mmetsp:Transcript_40536/g.79407  ORF Transcript_40536/g.79407 Transcript_40536/m.79407 type:complete len:218 (+) Transcript_40536:1195-1848(+)
MFELRPKDFALHAVVAPLPPPQALHDNLKLILELLHHPPCPLRLILDNLQLQIGPAELACLILQGIAHVDTLPLPLDLLLLECSDASPKLRGLVLETLCLLHVGKVGFGHVPVVLKRYEEFVEAGPGRRVVREAAEEGLAGLCGQGMRNGGGLEGCRDFVADRRHDNVFPRPLARHHLDDAAGEAPGVRLSRNTAECRGVEGLWAHVVEGTMHPVVG